jgi:hypothetical protein
MTKERAELASTIAMLVSSELLGEYNVQQECHHDGRRIGSSFPLPTSARRSPSRSRSP